MTEQERWNDYGKQTLAEVQQNPDKYLVTGWRAPHAVALRNILEEMDLQGKTILDIGCGRGEMTVWLAQKGATLSGVDLGPDLVAAAQVIAEINKVKIDYRVGSVTELPFPDSSFELVIGKAILHHLNPDGSLVAAREALRVLKPGGSLIVFEPIEDSRLFDFLQNAIPRGKPGDKYYRPSVLQRSAWKEHLSQLDERVMKSEEFEKIGDIFGNCHIVYSGLTVRAAGIGGNHPQTAARLLEFDDKTLKRIGFLRRYARNVVAIYQKARG